MRKILTDPTGLVVNIIEWDPVASAGYQPPDGLAMHDDDPDAVIGDQRESDGSFTRPPDPDPEEPQGMVTIPTEDYEALLAAADVDRLDPEQAARIGVDTGKTARKQ